MRVNVLVEPRTWPAVAIEYINAIAGYRPYFVEEPVPQENVDALAEVRRAVRVPIATGERLVTRHQFREVLEKQAAHIIQPDLCHCGGLWEAKKIAAMAEAYYVGVAPHNPLGPISLAACPPPATTCSIRAVASPSSVPPASARPPASRSWRRAG